MGASDKVLITDQTATSKRGGSTKPLVIKL